MGRKKNDKENHFLRFLQLVKKMDIFLGVLENIY